MFGFLSCAAADPTTPGRTAGADKQRRSFMDQASFHFLVLCYSFSFFVIVRHYRRADRFSGSLSGTHVTRLSGCSVGFPFPEA